MGWDGWYSTCVTFVYTGTRSLETRIETILTILQVPVLKYVNLIPVKLHM